MAGNPNRKNLSWIPNQTWTKDLDLHYGSRTAERKWKAEDYYSASAIMMTVILGLASCAVVTMLYAFAIMSEQKPYTGTVYDKSVNETADSTTFVITYLLEMDNNVGGSDTRLWYYDCIVEQDEWQEARVGTEVEGVVWMHDLSIDCNAVQPIRNGIEK